MLISSGLQMRRYSLLLGRKILRMTACMRQLQQKKRQIPAARLLRTRTTFAQSVMVSVGVSKLGVTDLIFVDPGIKVHREYYREVLLSQELLPAIREMSVDFFVFQPAHRARDTLQLLQCDTPEFIAPDLWSPNSPDLNLWFGLSRV